MHEMVNRRRELIRRTGIDVALALDAESSILTDVCDTAIVVSRDRDLMEIAAEVDQHYPDPAKQFEVAYVSERRGDERAPAGYDHYQEIGEAIVDLCRDGFNYSRTLDRGDFDRFLGSL